MTDHKPTNYFQLKQIGFLSPLTQIILIGLLFVATNLANIASYLHNNLLFGYPLFCYGTIIFAPLYEEVIFRGLIIKALDKKYSARSAILISSVIFGLWHLKNLAFSPLNHVVIQMLYATVLFGPAVACLAQKTRTIWPGVILHYVNNLVAFALIAYMQRP